LIDVLKAIYRIPELRTALSLPRLKLISIIEPVSGCLIAIWRFDIDCTQPLRTTAVYLGIVGSTWYFGDTTALSCLRRLYVGSCAKKNWS
jgi:hypothetical protein